MTRLVLCAILGALIGSEAGMLRERVSSDVFVFTSDLYAQTTAGVVVTPEGSVVIDTMPFPIETAEIARFASKRSPRGVRYVILTHYHADHTYGACRFPDAQTVAHERCRQLLAAHGQPALEEVRAEAPELEQVVLRMPDITLQSGEMALYVGGRTFRILWTPGHSEDMLAVFVEEPRILFASDTIMPVPVVVGGNLETLKQSLQALLALEPESVVQGHGEVILRGEVEEIVRANIGYLDTIAEFVENAVAKGRRRETMYEVGIEQCGLSRVALNGEAPGLHTANLLALYDEMTQYGR